MSGVNVSTKRLSDGFVLIQVEGRSLQGLWPQSVRGMRYYQSDTFPKRYMSIAEAKEDTLKRYLEGHWNKRFARANPRRKKAKLIHKRLAASRKFAKKSFRTIRIGKHGKLLRVGCPKGRWKRSRCAVGMKAQGLMHPKKYVGIAQASRRKR